MGVASCIEYAADSMLTATKIKPDISSAAAALFDMLRDLGGPLEEVMEAAGGLPPPSEDE